MLHILITRPAEDAARDAASAHAAGARVTCIPLLEILPQHDPAAVAAALMTVDAETHCCFVSVNAVRHGLPHLLQAGHTAASLRAYAIGNATRAALADAGVQRIATPRTGADSEALLAHPDLQQVAGQRALIVNGHGVTASRTLLGDTLAARGATVSYLTCYARRWREDSGAQLSQVFANDPPDCLQLMSIDTGLALLARIPATTLSRATVLVPHPRIATALRSAGLAQVAVADLQSWLAARTR
jgi:uroporphyrinogen-III synthase